MINELAIWTSGGVEYEVLVLDYLGKGEDGRDYVSISRSATGIPVDELRFINDLGNPFVSVWFDPHGRMHFAE